MTERERRETANPQTGRYPKTRGMLSQIAGAESPMWRMSQIDGLTLLCARKMAKASSLCERQ